MNAILSPSLLSCCMMILNYNGREHLDDCLTTALLASKTYGRPCPVIVVDNKSTNDDVAYIHSRYPEVEVVAAEKDDYGFSFNQAVKDRSEDVVILLTNDMRYDKNFIKPLMDRMDDPEIFAATAKVCTWDGSAIITGKSRLTHRNFWYYKEWDNENTKPSYTLYASGGASAFRRSMFLELDGFDVLFRPAYYEEVDLSYRAWKRGWKVIYEPASVIYHKDCATIGKLNKEDSITRWIYRNHVLFSVKDCGNWAQTALFIALLPLRVCRSLLQGNAIWARSIIDALPRLPHALTARMRCQKQFLVGDERIMAMIDNGVSELEKARV